MGHWFVITPKTTPPKFNIDTKNDALENVSPFKHGYFDLFWVSMLVFGGDGL